MTIFASLILATVLLAALPGVIILIVLALRNPLRPAWLQRGGAESLAAVAITAAVSFLFAYQVSALVESGVTLLVALPLASAILLASAYILVRKFECRARLECADAGQSPFRRAFARPDESDTAPVGQTSVAA